MKINAHYSQPPASVYLDRLRDLLVHEVRLTTSQHHSPPANTDILIAGRPTREQLSSGSALQTLIIPWAGVPPETRTLLAEFPHIAAHNLHHNAQPVAEMALTLLLSAAKLIVPFDRQLRQDDWRARYRSSPVRLLAGKTALILGYGAVGRQTAVYCKALGMRVLATRRRPSLGSDGPADAVHPADALPELLHLADALLICLPHTDATNGLIGRKEISMMPKGSLMVNVGRGPIVDQSALYLALQNGRLHAAGLDVWYNYPRDEASRSQTPPADYPFRELDNVVMSPHRAGATTESNALRMAHLADLLNAAAVGKELPNRIDVAAGY